MDGFRRWCCAWLAAVLLAAGAGRVAAEPAPPSLPFPLGLPPGTVRGTLTVWTEEEFFHRVTLGRAMFPGELDALAETLRGVGWAETSPETDAAAAGRLAEALSMLRAAGAEDAARAVAGFYATGNRSWSLGTTQLIYLAGDRAELVLSFPFGGEVACPSAAPGEFAAGTALPLAGATFVRRSLQAEGGLTVATEQWASDLPPGPFFDRATAQLLAVGYRGGMAGGADAKEGADAAFSAMLGERLRVFERPGCQLTLLRTAGGAGEPAGYAFIARFVDVAAIAAGAWAEP